MKAIITVLLFAFLAFATPVKDANGYYQITNKEELIWLADSSNQPFTTFTRKFNVKAVITKDIDFGGDRWIPICAGRGDNQFTGIIDGQNHLISNILLDTDSIKKFFFEHNLHGETASDTASANNVAKQMIQNSGFIGSLAGTIRNLNLSGITVRSNANGGEALSPTADPIEKAVSVGSIVGWSNGGTIDGSVVSGVMSADGTGVALGGIVGNSGGGVIRNTISRVSIGSQTDTSEVYIGGIVGYTKKTPTMTNVVWDGEIIANNGKGKSGGIIGYVYSGTPSVTNAVFNADGVHDADGNVVVDAVGRMCAKCSVNGEITSFHQYIKGVYKVLDYGTKNVIVLFDKYKDPVQEGIFDSEDIGLEVDSVVFERRFTVGAYSTISFPFSYDVDHFEGATLLSLHHIDYDTWTAYVEVNNGGIEANVPYIILPTEEYITFHGSKVVSPSIPGTDESLDGQWQLFSVYNYVTGADRGDLRTSTYGFAAANTDNAKIGDFKKMGVKAYSYPFRALLEKVGTDGLSLSKSATGIQSSSEVPDYINVVLLPSEYAGDIEVTEPEQSTEKKETTVPQPTVIRHTAKPVNIGKIRLYDLLGRTVR